MARRQNSQSLFSSDGDVEIINDFIAIVLFNELVYRQLRQMIYGIVNSIGKQNNIVEFGPDPYRIFLLYLYYDQNSLLLQTT